MSDFWYYVRRSLKYKGRIALGMLAAVLSAACGALGLAAVMPILKVLFSPGEQTFRDFVLERNVGWIGHLLPDGLIETIPTDRYQGFLVLLVVVLCVSVFGSLMRIVQLYTVMWITIQTINDIRVTVFGKIIRLPLSSLQSTTMPVTEKVSRLIKDTNQLQRGMLALTGKTLAEALKGIGALTVALAYGWRLTVLALVAAPFLILFYRWHGKRLRRAARNVLAQSARMLSTITQSLQGVRVVKVHTAERVEVGRLRRVTEDVMRADLPLRWAKSTASPMIEIMAVSTFCVVSGYAYWGVVQNTADPAKVLNTLIALGVAIMSLRQFTFMYTEVHESAAAAERLLESERLTPERPKGDQKPHLGRCVQSITFDEVWFTYPGAERPSLRGVNLSIPAGKTYAFVGPNGCGKTTLLSLIPHLYPATKGSVLVDGHDVGRVNLKSLRNQISVVTQETVLFNDSIINNITYGLANVPKAMVEAVAQRAYAEQFILDKPHAYETVLGEQGMGLSGGQRQRLAIARAMLRDPAILILDEATSMIDAETEALITQALDQFCKGRTSLVIAHRLSTVINADQIVVMNFGQVVDQGTHQELLERCVLYQQLCKTQLVSDESERSAQGSPVPASPASKSPDADLAKLITEDFDS